MPVYRLFRDSIRDYMRQLGMLGADQTHDVDAMYERQQGLYLHLEQSAAEDWVAEDEQLGIVGWARSIERDDHLQLTHFFVDPAAQGSGIGSALLNRAFPLGRGKQRSIIATTSPNALSLYLRQGVSFQGMAICFIGRPRIRPIDTDLALARAEPSAATLARVQAIDSAVLGFQRAADLDYYLRQQPLYLARRDGAVVGYAFGSDGKSSGPAAALSAQDLPVLLQQIEISACEAGLDELSLMIPAAAAAGVDWALAAGFRIEPFYEVLLANYPMQLDRYLITETTFLW